MRLRSALLALALCAAARAAGCQKNIGLLEPHVYSAKELRRDLACYVDKGPCAKVGAACKRRMPQDVASACSKCSPRHKHHLRLFLERARQLFPEELLHFRAKYDPSGKHFVKLETSLLKY